MHHVAIMTPSLKLIPKISKYCILIRLKNTKKIERPFQINKKGFGSGGAWITVSDIGKVVK